MLFDVSYTNPEINLAIDQLVGRPFPILSRFTMGAIGSQRFELIQGSQELERKIKQTTKTHFCNIGLRPKGIKIWFTVKLHTYLLALPYVGLNISVINNQLRLSHGDWWLELTPAHRARLNMGFINKMKELQGQSNPDEA